jgi:hypothetical protein
LDGAAAKLRLVSSTATANRSVAVIDGLSITNDATIDLGNNDVVIRSGALAIDQPLIAAGDANGFWTGPGIDSSAAAADTRHVTGLGLIANTTACGAALSGIFDSVSVAAGDFLVKYTYTGDANLDGKVDGSDYSLIDAGNAAEGGPTGWYNGDFNYDGAVDGSDYTLIDNAFNNQRAAIPSAAVAAITTSNSAAAVAITPRSAMRSASPRFVPPPPLAGAAHPDAFSTSAAADDFLELLKRRRTD